MAWQNDGVCPLVAEPHEPAPDSTCHFVEHHFAICGKPEGSGCSRCVGVALISPLSHLILRQVVECGSAVPLSAEGAWAMRVGGGDPNPPLPDESAADAGASPSLQSLKHRLPYPGAVDFLCPCSVIFPWYKSEGEAGLSCVFQTPVRSDCPNNREKML